MLEEQKKKQNLKSYIIIIGCSILLGIPLLNPSLNIFLDDGVQHIARFVGMRESFEDGQFFMNIIPSFSNGFGYSWNIFYGAISAVVPFFIYMITNSFIISFKLFLYCLILATGISMYLSIKVITNDPKTALLGSIIYMFSPYLLTDIYIRHAVGECLGFAFAPLIFSGIYSVFNQKRKNHYLLIGGAGLILSHNVSVIMVVPFALIYTIFYIKKSNIKNVLKLFLILIIIALITAFFWMPLIEHKIHSDYAVFENNMMSTVESIESKAVNPLLLLIGNEENLMRYELSVLIILLIMTPWAIDKVPKIYKKTYIIFYILGLIATIFSSTTINWNYMPSIFYMIQFPFRLLMLTNMFLSVICAINFFIVCNKRQILLVALLVIIMIGNFFTLICQDDLLTKNNLEKRFENFALGQLTGKEGDNIAGTARGEYLPTKAYHNQKYIVERDEILYLIDGSVNHVEYLSKKGTNYKFRISTDYAKLELPYIYYLGYCVKANGVQIPIEESEKGFLQITLENIENAEIELTYEGTNVMKISMIISIATSIVLVLCYIIKKLILKNENI